MAHETNQTQAPLLCATGCGFYGNPRTNAMCSVCYKDFVQRQNSNARVSPPDSSGVGTVAESPSTPRLEDIAAASPAPAPPQPITTADQTSAPSSSPIQSPASQSRVAEDDSPWDRAAPTAEDVQASYSATESRVAIPQEQSIMGMAGAPGSSAAGSDDGGFAGAPAELGSRRGKRKLKEKFLEDEEGAGASTDPQERSPKQKKNRCFTCRKKVGLTGFDCRCGNVFCGAHRYSDVHGCTFDYRADAAEKIRKENPMVVGEKINKI